jgi:RNA-directed DNA polymerase
VQYLLSLSQFTLVETAYDANEIYTTLKNPKDRISNNICRLVSKVNFELLGHGFVPIYKKGIKGQYQLVVKQASWEKFKRNLKSLTKKTKPMSLLERLERLNQVCRGWMNNYRLTNIYAKLKKLDEWLRNRLRYCIWHDWKKLERKRKNGIQLGIEEGQAYAWSRTRMGGWAVAQSPILKTTITLSRLKRRGYKPMIDYINKQQTSIW